MATEQQIVLDGETFSFPSTSPNDRTKTGAAEAAASRASNTDLSKAAESSFSAGGAGNQGGPHHEQGSTSPTEVLVAGRSKRKARRYREIFYQNTGFGRRLLRPKLLLCNLAVAGALFGFFVWNFVVLTSQFVSEQNDPPVKNTITLKDSGEPNMPAIVLCNPILNVPIRILQIGWTSGGRQTESCFTDEQQTLEPPVVCNNTKFPRVHVLDYFAYRPEIEADDYNEATPPVVDPDLLVYCIAVNASGLPGYNVNRKTRRPSKKNTLFLAVDLNPFEITPPPSLVFTSGIEVYLFARRSDIPVQINNQVINSSFSLIPRSTDTVIAGANLASIVTLGYSEFVNMLSPGSVSVSYSPNAFATQIHPTVLQEFNSTTGDRLSILSLQYRTPQMESFEFTPTSFSATFGAVSGWAGSLLGWDCLGLLFVLEKMILLLTGRNKVVDWADDLL